MPWHCLVLLSLALTPTIESIKNDLQMQKEKVRFGIIGLFYSCHFDNFTAELLSSDS